MFCSSPRFKPHDFSMKQISNEKNKDAKIMQGSYRINNLEQKSNEPTTVKINFRATPKPTDCQWMILTETVEIQTNQSCEILQSDGIKGEYFVNLSTTSEDPILLFITNELGTSKFQSKEAKMKMSASFSNVNLTVPLSIVLPLLFLFSLVGCFILRRRQRRNIFTNSNRNPNVSTSTTYSYSTMMSRDSRKTCNITSNMGISADTTKRTAHATEMENDKF